MELLHLSRLKETIRLGNELNIIGAGGHAKVVIEVARQLGYGPLYVYDDSPELEGKRVSGEAIVGKVNDLLSKEKGKVFVAIGSNQVRKRMIKSLSCASFELITLISPSATVSSSSTLDSGVLIAPNAVINAEAHIDKGAIINTSSIVEHDVKVGRYSHVAPNAVLLGAARVGNNCFVGASSVILPEVALSSDVTLGANTTATRSLEAGTYIGSPARLMTSQA